jgi:hypothetical protein
MLRLLLLSLSLSLSLLLLPLPSALTGASAGMAGVAGVASAPPASVEEGLTELDGLFSGLLPWLERVYDPVSGGFYESVGLREGREDRAYGPDIQSTHMAISLLSENRALQSLPRQVLDGFAHYFRSRQDPQTGFFSDPDYPEMKNSPRIMGRALSFSRASLRRFGIAPLYPYPGAKTIEQPPPSALVPAPVPAPALASAPAPASATSRPARKSVSAPAATTPAHLASVEAFRAWLDKRPWHFAWTAIDEIQSQTTLILLLEPALRDALVDEALRSVSSRQDPETGLIKNGGTDIVRISGAFKLVLFCKDMKRPVPRVEKLRDAVLAWFRSGPETDRIFFIRNAVDVLSELTVLTGRKLAPDELLLVLRVALVELGRFRCADGAFSSMAGAYYITPNDLYLGERRIAKAGPQSNVNGTTMAWRARQQLYRLAAGRNAPPLAVPADFRLVR